MTTENNVFRALRKEDFLDLTFELVNLSVEGNPLQLIRKDTDKPSLLVVHFPPQHIAEETFSQKVVPEMVPPPSIPARAMLSGPSRLVFELPEDINSWPLTLETFLNWGAYKPILAANALPPDAVSGPGPKKPELYETALEIPFGLYLSPDKFGAWRHYTLPIEHNGNYELWHTSFGTYKLREGSTEGDFTKGGAARVIGNADINIPRGVPFFETSLTDIDRAEIPRLSSDFSLPTPPSGPTNIFLMLRWSRKLAKLGLSQYIPSPVNVRQLMLSSAGAWANLESKWNYPFITFNNENLGFPKFGLDQWQHVATQGRDQYVKTVRKAFLCDTGHRVSIITITERKFTIGPTNVDQSTAFLRKKVTIEVQEPIKDYSKLKGNYSHEGRELPFKNIHITTRSTPVLDTFDASKPFWPKVDGKPFRFQIVAEDKEGNKITFDRPLMCVPVTEGLTLASVIQEYDKYQAWHTTSIQTQPIAFTETTSESKGKTTLNANNLTFYLQQAKGQLLPGQSIFLPIVKSAEVNLPSVEQLLGRSLPVNIEFEVGYLENGFDAVKNASEIFAKLKTKLDLTFPAEKAGGLIKPDMSIEGLSRSIGSVPNLDGIKNGTFDTSIFDKARFLGGITLKDILKTVDFDPSSIKAAADLSLGELQDLLDDVNRRIQVPILTNRRLNDGSIETLFLWKPEISDYPEGPSSSFFKFMTGKSDTGFINNGQLIIHVSLITSLDGKASYKMKGELKEIALNFVDALKLKLKLLSFNSESGKKTDVTAEGVELEFQGPLKFVDTLKNILPADGFSDPPFLDVTPSGIRAGYTLDVPSVAVGIFSLQNINLSAALTLPFIDQPAGARFSISERHKPFLVSVGLFGGGGFFSLALSAKGIEEIEAAIEFGASISLNLGVASGGVSIMAGIYFGMIGNEVKLTGYLRCGGHLSVLGIISISVEFYLAFTYRDKGGDKGEVWGQASLTVGVKVLFFSKSVTLTVERRFAGAAGDPTFAEMMGPEIDGDYPVEWEKYCNAFD